MNNRKVVFIMGNAHSGSTLVGLILGSHSQMFGLGELSMLHEYVDQPYQGFPKLCYVCEGECEFWNKRVPFPVLRRYFSRKNLLARVVSTASRYHRSIYDHLFEWTGYNVMVDYSKPVKWIRRQLQPSYHWQKMTPYLLYLARDGRAVVNSQLRKYPDKKMEDEAARWKHNIERMNDLYDEFAPAQRFTLSYEQLTTQPTEVAKAVCDWLHLDFEPSMLSYWEHDHHATAGNLGTRSLIFRYRTEFADQPKATAEIVPEQFKARHGDYYDRLGLAIKPDLRWRNELSEEQLRIFETVAGETNKPFAYNL
jgi:hypothetical protein